MKKLLPFFLGGIVVLCVVNACHDDDDDGTQIPAETIATNKWIHDDMDSYYFWTDQLPDVDYRKESDSEEYFKKLIYKDDPWSWITDDYASLAADYDGVPVTMGYDPSFFYYDSASDRVIMVVNYVYPGSAAAEAGLKRGDVILKVNGQEFNDENYYEVYSGNSYSVLIGKARLNSDKTVSIEDTKVTLSMTARVTTTDPAVWHEVIDTLDHKIGYLAYVEFVAGADSVFLETLDEIFVEFKSKGVSDLIVDLRYNPGGESTAAIHLASEIAPAAVINSSDKYLVSLNYNSDFQAYLESKAEFKDNLYYRFSKPKANLNLDKVYFLTTDGTASASELVITGLDPYMEVVQVGDSTYGKYAGAFILPDNEDEEKAKWAIIPIVMKYANYNKYTDFKDGLYPDFVMNDNLIFAVPFGDTADPMTKRAIEDIAGVPQSVATRSRFDLTRRFKKIIPENRAMNLRRNLYLPVTPELKKLLVKE
ncbi:MAG: S41 family peptidase [Prolixibacteraceae bacterium]